MKDRIEDEPMKDGITFGEEPRLSGTSTSLPMPRVVSGKKILAVTKSKKAIYLQEITPPKTK